MTVFEYAKLVGVTKTCREFDVARSIFYEWKKRYEAEGRTGLYRKEPIAHRHPRKTPQVVIDKILELRQLYQLGAIRIMYYMKRYHDMIFPPLFGVKCCPSRSVVQSC